MAAAGKSHYTLLAHRCPDFGLHSWRRSHTLAHWVRAVGFLVVLKSSLLTSFVSALVPVLLCLAYIFGLRQGKPPGYDRDIFECVLTSRLTGRNLTHAP